MKKKTKKSKAVGKKPAKRRVSRGKKELNPVEVRKDVSKLVESNAKKMTAAVIGDGLKGQLAPVKYLFELAHIFPPGEEEKLPSKEEESFAETLLDRLGIPKTPVVADEYEKGNEIVIAPVKTEEKVESEVSC